jgi:hypothetical protein
VKNPVKLRRTIVVLMSVSPALAASFRADRTDEHTRSTRHDRLQDHNLESLLETRPSVDYSANASETSH